MRAEQKIINRFQVLLEFADRVVQTKRHFDAKTQRIGNHVRKVSPSYDKVDTALSYEWGINCLNHLKRIFGSGSVHFKRFNELFPSFDSIAGFNNVIKAAAILKAAKDDYENGYLFDTRTLIEAEIFSDIIEQSEELLKKGHYQVAAVVAGCVLEDGLRKLCDKNSITFPKKLTIEPMNVELAKIGIYNQFIKDKISSLGKLRNHAAHGEWTEFTEKDVKDMIEGVRRFMEDYFS